MTLLVLCVWLLNGVTQPVTDRSALTLLGCHFSSAARPSVVLLSCKPLAVVGVRRVSASVNA